MEFYHLPGFYPKTGFLRSHPYPWLRSPEHEKLWGYLNYDSPNFKDCSEVNSNDPLI